MKITPLPRFVETLIAYFPTVWQCGQAVSDIVASGTVPAAMEMIDQLTLNAVEDYLNMGLNRQAGALLILELDGQKAGIDYYKRCVSEIIDNYGVFEKRWANNTEERLLIWRARKMSFGALGRLAPNGYVLDGVIPRSKLREAIERIDAISQQFQIKIANVYHAGDGNLHPCLLYSRQNVKEVELVIKASHEVLKMCVELGGTLSGEHGIGIEKLLDMPLVFTQRELEIMHAVGRCFDYANLMNPGKVIPNLKNCGETGNRPLLRHKVMGAC